MCLSERFSLRQEHKSRKAILPASVYLTLERNMKIYKILELNQVLITLSRFQKLIYTESSAKNSKSVSSFITVSAYISAGVCFAERNGLDQMSSRIIVRKPMQ